MHRISRNGSSLTSTNEPALCSAERGRSPRVVRVFSAGLSERLISGSGFPINWKGRASQ